MLADESRETRHGRDNKLMVWKLGLADENDLDKILPKDAMAMSPKQPWVLHLLTVNTLNFCSFAMCCDGMPQMDAMGMVIGGENDYKPILIAVPNTVDSGGV
jgi:ASTRA-associated protein 1